MRSDAVLDRLTALHPKLIDLSLGRVERLLSDLGQPQTRLPPVIHIAGTNGKGSTIAFLRAMCEAAGLRVHAYTSPHLVRFAERIVLAGAEIDEAALAAVLEDCETANDGRPITFFEITTAVALFAFSRTPADVLLLETGLGGRFDATNVVARPALTAITPVAMDHMQYLGDTLSQIAFEKAGIVKPDVPCVTAAQSPEAAEVISRQADAVGASLVLGERDWRVAALDDGAEYRDASGTVTIPTPALLGRHQVDNAALAVACLRHLPAIGVDGDAMARGARTVRWRGRLQHLDGGALAARLPPGWELWLDGAHNPAAARALDAFIGNWRDRPLFAILGMLGKRDPVEFLRPLAARITALHTVAIPGVESTATAADCADGARTLGIDAAPADGIMQALETIAGRTDGPARVLICGSLYLAGHVLGLDGG